jgi:hypothetical protein
MKKIMSFVLTLAVMTTLSAQGTRVAIKLTTGTNGLLPKSSIYFKLNYLNGTGSSDYVIYSLGGLTEGFAPNSVFDAVVSLPTTISHPDIKSFTIRQVSAVGNTAEPYDNWDLKGLKVSLIDIMGPRTWTIGIYDSSAAFVTHFTQFQKSLTIKLQ